MKVKGYAAQSAEKPLAPFSFERRAVGENDVLIEIDYCGVCHSDIHTARNEWGGTLYPCIPGHEIAGHVKEVGLKVKKFKVGDKVGVGCLVGSCRTCAACKDGLEQYCEKGIVGTYNGKSKNEPGHTFGGYSTHIVVDDSFVLKMPEHLDLAGAAPLLCAGITTYSPMRYLGVSKGDRLGVLGLGGLGHMAVKLGASFGAEVTVLSGSASKQADAKKLGAANFALTSRDELMTEYGNYFDYIIDTVAAKHDLNQALGLLKRDGTLIMVGAAEKPLDLSVFGLILKRRSIMGSLIGGIPETQEMLDHCGKHKITSEIEMIKAEQINDAYERMIKGQVKYRFVIDGKSF